MRLEMQRFVSNLTVPTGDRQRFDAILDQQHQPKSRLLAAAAVVVILAIGSDALATQNWQPIEDISATAESWLRAHSGDQAGTTTVKAGTLDPRHKLEGWKCVPMRSTYITNDEL